MKVFRNSKRMDDQAKKAKLEHRNKLARNRYAAKQQTPEGAALRAEAEVESEKRRAALRFAKSDPDTIERKKEAAHKRYMSTKITESTKN